MNVDRRGVSRGSCTNTKCDCDQYERPLAPEISTCAYCSCPPTVHENLATRAEMDMHGSSTSDEQKFITSAAAYECALFIDDSNIFIEGQKYYARHLGLEVPQDPRCRIDIGNLGDLVADGRTWHGILYGSEPPAKDKVWKKIREEGVQVKTYIKNVKGKEKGVDTGLTTDAVMYANKAQARKHTVIIIAGDRDYCYPLETILGEKREWTIELVAFQSSISSQMNTMSLRYDRFKIKPLDSSCFPQKRLLQCCFVEAEYPKPLSQALINSSIKLHFKEPLISQEANVDEQILKQYAEKLTQITCIPCCYHLGNCKLLYIIGCDWFRVKSGQYTVNNFVQICRENEHQLNKTCREISEKYEKYSTMTERDATVDAVQLENRSTGPDMEEMAEFFDEDSSSQKRDDDIVTDTTQSLDPANTESDRRDEDSDTEKSSSKATRKYCKFEFSCEDGQTCKYAHTKEQLDFFQANDGKGRGGYKSKPCWYYIKGFCKKGEDKAPNCAYYHSVEEARCYVCKKYGEEYIGHASHDHEEQ